MNNYKLKKDYIFEHEITINEKIVAKKYINGVTIDRNFLGRILPVRILDLNLDIDLHSDIVRFMKSTNPTISVRHDIYYKEKEDNESTIGSEQIRKRYSTGEFIGIISTNAPAISREEKISLDYDSKERGDTINVAVALFNKEDKSCFNSDIVNCNAKNVTLQNLVYHIFSTTSKKHNIVLSPLDNKNNYSNLLLPPFGTYQALKYLDSEFGLYKTDYNVYIENNIIYLLNYNNVNRITKNNEESVLNINARSLGKEKTIETGMRFSNGNQYIVCNKKASLTTGVSIKHIGAKKGMEVSSKGGTHNFNSELSNAIEVELTSRNINKSNTIKYETYEIVLDNLPIKIEPYSYVILTTQDGEKKYRIRRHYKVMTQQSSKDIITIFRNDDEI